MRKIIVMGSIGAVVIILLAGISIVVCAQTIKENPTINIKIDKIVSDFSSRLSWVPGQFIIYLIFIIFSLILLYTLMVSPEFPSVLKIYTMSWEI